MTRPCLARCLPILLVPLAGWAAPARAQLPADARFSYDLFVPGSPTPVSGSLFYTPGQPLAVQVYLRQTAGATSVLTADQGLVSGGVRLTYGSPSGTAGVIAVANVADIAINSGTTATQFNDPATSDVSRKANPDFAEFFAVTDFTRGALPDANGRVFLGTVTFQTPATAGTTTVLTVDDIPVLDDVITFTGFGQGYSLDPRADPLTVTVTPVPEPAAVLGVSTVALGLTLLRSRRRSVGRPHSEGDRCPGTRG